MCDMAVHVSPYNISGFNIGSPSPPPIRQDTTTAAIQRSINRTHLGFPLKRRCTCTRHLETSRLFLRNLWRTRWCIRFLPQDPGSGRTRRTNTETAALFPSPAVGAEAGIQADPQPFSPLFLPAATLPPLPLFFLCLHLRCLQDRTTMALGD